jgi:Fe2+ or Zn2+ uptake regulation protein
MAKGTGIRGTLLEVLVEADGKLKAADVIEAALARHPLQGKTPKATAHARLGELVKAGLVSRSAGAMYKATAAGRRAAQS